MEFLFRVLVPPSRYKTSIGYLTLKGSYHNSFLYLPKGELSIIHYTRTTKQNTRRPNVLLSAERRRV